MSQPVKRIAALTSAMAVLVVVLIVVVALPASAATRTRNHASGDLPLTHVTVYAQLGFRGAATSGLAQAAFGSMIKYPDRVRR